MTGSTGRQWLLAVAIFAVAAVGYTWPLAGHLTGVLAAPQGPGDPYLNTWILGWDLETLSTSPRAVLTGRVFDANIFYPAQKTLAYSDHLLLPATVIWPVYAVTHNVALCYNLVLLLSLVASALAMFALARQLTASAAAATVAGLVWGFWPFHTAHLIHLQLQGLYFLPLAFLSLHRLIATRRRRDGLALGLFTGLQVVTSVYVGLMTAVALAVGGTVLSVAAGRWRNSRYLRRVLLAVVTAGVVVAPFTWPYLDVQRKEGFVRNLYQAGLNAAHPIHYLRVPPDNAVYGRTGLLRPAADADERGEQTGVERELFVGFSVLLLAAAGVRGAGWRERRILPWPYLAIAAAGFGLSLGPDGVRPVYAWLHEHVFGFQAIRAPARFAILVAFGAAVLAALGVAALAIRRPRAVWLCAGVIALEFANAPLTFAPAPPASTPVGQWLAQAPGPGAVLYLPLQLDLENTPFMIESLEHRRPIVNGYSGQRPAFYTSLVDTMKQFPSADALWTLRDLNVRFLVTPAPITQFTDPTPLVQRAVLDGRTIYELVWTPEIEESLERPEAPAPPPAPATLPFGPGEELRYRVFWRGQSAVTLAAGEILFRVTDPPPVLARSGETLQLEVQATTAPWVSSFFEARDRFYSLTRADLLPTLHAQELHEGRRVVDRAAWFDPKHRVVRSGNGAPDAPRDALALPLSQGARDPVSAFFYARAVPLVSGETLRIPVNDLGRSVVVELRGGTVESITAEGHPQGALRVDGRIEYRVVNRQGPRATLWISTDDRRVPLLIDIDAPFGSFRAELVEYRRGAR